jgi:hypothetical protein
MSVEELEKAITALPEAEQWRLHVLLRHRLEDDWDRQMARDAENGKLDKLAEEALADVKAGRFREL